MGKESIAGLGRPWWNVTLLFVLSAAIAVLICFLLDPLYGTIAGGGALLLLGLALYFNPRFRYFRCALTLLSTWLASRSFPTIIFELNHRESNLAFYFGNEVGWSFDLACGIVVATLFVLGTV